MEIKCPGDLRRNQLPPEQEVREVVTAVCQKCGLDPARVRLNYVGGDRRKQFPRKGVKLVRACQYTVQLYVGCASGTVATHFQILDTNNRAMSGNELFQTMTRVFTGRTYCISDDLIRESRHARNGSNGKTHEVVSENVSVSPVVEVSKPVEIGVSQNIQPTELTDGPSVIEEGHVSESRQQLDIVYKHYFDDPAKLHLAVCALVALCNEDTTTPFSFSLFERVLEESNVPKTAGLPLSLLRPFLYRKFVERINPGIRPSRYLITEEAIKFARGKIPDSPVMIKKVARQSVVKTENISEETRETLINLKNKSKSHQAVLEKLEKARTKLDELKEINVEEEEKKINGEAASLQKRLNELSEYRLSLAKRRSDMAVVEKEIESLTTQAEDPEIKKVLKQIEDLRKLLE